MLPFAVGAPANRASHCAAIVFTLLPIGVIIRERGVSLSKIQTWIFEGNLLWGHEHLVPARDSPHSQSSACNLRPSAPDFRSPINQPADFHARCQALILSVSLFLPCILRINRARILNATNRWCRYPPLYDQSRLGQSRSAQGEAPNSLDHAHRGHRPPTRHHPPLLNNFPNSALSAVPPRAIWNREDHSMPTSLPTPFSLRAAPPLTAPMPSIPLALAPKPASAAPRSTRSPTASPAKPPFCLPRTRPPTSSTARNSKTNTSPKLPPRSSSSTNAPTPPGDSTASRCSKPTSPPAPPTRPPSKPPSHLTSSTPIRPRHPRFSRPGRLPSVSENSRQAPRHPG